MPAPLPYLNFPGTCEEAFLFYADTFRGTITHMGRFKQLPPDVTVPAGYGDKLMHVSLAVDGAPFLMGSDAPEGFGPTLQVGNNMSLSVFPADEAEAERLYKSLSSGGNVIMELAPTFWAKLYAMVTDRFGIQWLISYGNK